MRLSVQWSTRETAENGPVSHDNSKRRPGVVRRGIAALAGTTVRPSSALPGVMLSITGLALLSAAALAVAVPFGLAVAGVAAFVLEWRITAS